MTIKKTVKVAPEHTDEYVTYRKHQRLELIKVLLPAVTGSTDIAFVQEVLKLGPTTYDPVKHWPQYVATRAVQMAEAILKANDLR